MPVGSYLPPPLTFRRLRTGSCGSPLCRQSSRQFAPYLGLALLVWWIVGRALEPVRTVTRLVAARRPGTLDPLPQAGLPDEIQPLVSALNETVDRVGLKYAQKVFRDGFVKHRDAFTVHVPRVPLGRLYGDELRAWLSAHGVTLRENAGARKLLGTAAGITGVELRDGETLTADRFVLAVPFDRVCDLLPPELAALPYFAGSRLQAVLPALCAQAYAFDAPLRPLAQPGDHVLELFHGPTAAFKDYAARFLAGALAHLRDDGAATTTILVATSGDTGAAVASAFHRRPGFRVAILYPDGRVSPRQAHGLGCWGDNVHAFRVDGTFDDCQRMVKQALSDTALRARVLSSGDSS